MNDEFCWDYEPCSLRGYENVDWEDREQVLNAVRDHGCLFECAVNFFNDGEVITTALETRCGQDVLERVTNITKDMALTAVMMSRGEDMENVISLLDRWTGDHDVMLAAVTKNPMIVSQIGDELKEDREIFLVVVKNYGWALEHAGASICDDKEIVQMAVKNSGSALSYASDRLKDDRELVKIAVETNGNALRHASERLQDDKEIVMLSLTSHWSLMSASERLRDDKDVLMEAMKHDASLLRFASDRLKRDRDVVMEGIRHNGGFAFEHADKSFRSDKDFILSVLTYEGFNKPSENVQSRFGHPCTSAKSAYYHLISGHFLDESLLDDKDIIKAGVEICEMTMIFASQRIQHDPDFAQYKKYRPRLMTTFPIQ